MPMPAFPHLQQLARLYGVQTAYYDMEHRRRQASAETLLAVLRLLGASVNTIRDVPSAWRERQQAWWRRPTEPVVVAWEGAPCVIQVRLHSNSSETGWQCHLRLETGEWRHWEQSGAGVPVVAEAEVAGERYVLKRFVLPDGLPLGYHRLTLELAGNKAETLIISAPLKAYSPTRAPDPPKADWGVFLPLYALQTERSWGSGDFSALEALTVWMARLGGQVIGTLPLLPVFYDRGESSPYRPVSRLLWNELYLDINKVPELQRCPSAQALLAALPVQNEIERACGGSLVDYRKVIALKRRILEELCRYCFEASERAEALHRFAEANPVVADYALFRAAGEKQGVAWHSWSPRLKEGTLSEGDYDEAVRRYYLYAQWLAHQQVQNFLVRVHEERARLYLDLPLGAHPDGYDAWRERDIFVHDVSAGAPPDAVFTGGQDWAFPPLHPEKIREQGYRYFIAYLCHHLRHAGILRFDHVMGLHRLFWVPRGMEVSQGVYVRYRPEEFYAILALESRKHQSIILGEDLGTVPPEVRPAMTRHGLYRMYVVDYELPTYAPKTLRLPPPGSVASVDTHDMPPFASFWQGLDIGWRHELGLLDDKAVRRERKVRQHIRQTTLKSFRRKGWLKKSASNIRDILTTCLAFLSATPAAIVLVNLEDLWLETQPQNVPGTTIEPNWRRKARYKFETFSQLPEVVEALKEIDRLRKKGS